MMEGNHKNRSRSSGNRNSSCLKATLKTLKQFGTDTSLHGFHHITDKGSIVKKISFSIICCFSIVFCIYLVWLQLQRYQNNIVTTTLTSTAYPVWEVPFPSVVICNYNIVYKSSVDKMIKTLKFPGVTERTLKEFFMNLSSLINLDEFVEIIDYNGVYKTLYKYGYTIDKLMLNLVQPCEKMFKKCYWKTKEVPCLNLFKLVRTSLGYCCGFNQKGFDDGSDEVHEYAMGAGPAFGLRLILDPENEEYYSTIKSVVGFSVAVLPSIFFPTMESYGNSLLESDEMTLYLKPTVISTSSEVKGLKIKTRECFLANEGNLRWNTMYSFPTCLQECKVKAIQELCDCVPYFYPHQAGNLTCTYESNSCLRRNEYNYNSLAVTATTKDTKEVPAYLRKARQCDCLPECDDLTYEYHSDTAKVTQIVGESDISNISILNVYFKTVECTKMERRVYLTWDSLLASIGGIFGLCLGGSVLSVLECVYYIFRTVETPVQKICFKTKKKKVDLLFTTNNIPSKVSNSRPQVHKFSNNRRNKRKTEEFLLAFRN